MSGVVNSSESGVIEVVSVEVVGVAEVLSNGPVEVLEEGVVVVPREPRSLEEATILEAENVEVERVGALQAVVGMEEPREEGHQAEAPGTLVAA